MKIEFEIDTDKIFREYEANLEKQFIATLKSKCTAIFNTESQLEFNRNFKYAWAKVDDPKYKDDIAAIIYKWVTTEFRKDVIDYICKQKDFTVLLNGLKVDEEFAETVAHYIARNPSFRKKVLNKVVTELKQEESYEEA